MSDLLTTQLPFKIDQKCSLIKIMNICSRKEMIKRYKLDQHLQHYLSSCKILKIANL